MPGESCYLCAMMKLRQATLADVDTATAICAEARAFQHACGNVQWADGYPSAEVIGRDIEAGKGYMAEIDGNAVGYCVIDTDGDAEYDRAPHLWVTTGPYVAVHRLALADSGRGKGLSKRIFAEVERIIAPLGFNVIKVDTGLNNAPMHRLMDALGFTCRGTYDFPWGPRLAYEKTLR